MRRLREQCARESVEAHTQQLQLQQEATAYEEVRNGELGGEEDGVELAAVERVVERREVRVREAAQARPRARAVRAPRHRAAAARVHRAGELLELHRTRAELELAEQPRELRTAAYATRHVLGHTTAAVACACASRPQITHTYPHSSRPQVRAYVSLYQYHY